MAIDNLNFRCNENSHKLKYEFEDKPIPNKEGKNKKMDNEFLSSQNENEMSY